MRKRDFLKSLGLSVLGLGWARFGSGGKAAVPKPVPKPTRRTKNWVWITLDQEQSSEGWKRDFALMRASGIDAIIPEVYNGRHAYWASGRLPVKAERLEMMLPLAAAAGLEVHAWIRTMPCLLDDVLKNHPDWYNVNAKGEPASDKPAYVDSYRFLDPANPEVRRFIQETVKELAGIRELTGVHLDYIRHPDAILPKGLWSKYGVVQDRVYPPFDYGYTAYSREKFKKEHGLDPMDIKDPEDHEEWMRYRLDSVTELVGDYLVPAAHARDKRITAAVFPGPALARRMVRQDWGRWPLDAFLPMLYHNFYEEGAEWVQEQTRQGVAAVARPIYSGLFAPAVDATGLASIAQAALQGGASGVSIFAADSMNEDKWKTLARVVGVP